jgi:hypothetical protein
MTRATITCDHLLPPTITYDHPTITLRPPCYLPYDHPYDRYAIIYDQPVFFPPYPPSHLPGFAHGCADASLVRKPSR